MRNSFMTPLFIGLSAANVILLGLAFGLGLLATNANTQATTDLYASHITIGIASGFMTALTHTATYTYFMATSKWLQAATDKADLAPTEFVTPALANKSRVLATVVTAVLVTTLTMFAGAASDPTMRPWLPAKVHLLTGATAIMINLSAALVQFTLVQKQGRIMDRALAILNRHANTKTGSA